MYLIYGPRSNTLVCTEPYLEQSIQSYTMIELKDELNFLGIATLTI